jgi:hypothetical protein
MCLNGVAAQEARAEPLFSACQSFRIGASTLDGSPPSSAAIERRLIVTP